METTSKTIWTEPAVQGHKKAPYLERHWPSTYSWKKCMKYTDKNCWHIYIDIFCSYLDDKIQIIIYHLPAIARLDQNLEEYSEQATELRRAVHRPVAGGRKGHTRSLLLNSTLARTWCLSELLWVLLRLMPYWVFDLVPHHFPILHFPFLLSWRGWPKPYNWSIDCSFLTFVF